MLTGCVEEKYVAPTADRQGLTSLTAIFTSGPFTDQEMAKLSIEDDTQDRYIIPVPWFYPETSDDETTEYMTKVRVKAGLENNFTIDPPLTLIDLTKENWYTYTNPQGVARRICITGERVKSNKCELQAFTILDPMISGIINKNTRQVSLISTDDLSSCLAEAQISAHATITPDPSVAPLDYTNPVEFTVTAHDGVTKQTYTVMTRIPDKVPAGLVPSSFEQLFDFDPVSNLGLPNYTNELRITLASIGGHLIISTGDGSAPIYINSISGVKLGSINVGSADPGVVTNDENGNLLIANCADGGSTINIYRTKSVAEAPTLYHSFTNPSSLPTGKMKVIGNIDADAQIVFTNEGIPGVSASNTFTVLTVSGGSVTAVESHSINGDYTWGSGPVNSTSVVGASSNPADGWFASWYEPSVLMHVNSAHDIMFEVPSDMSGWGLNPNCLDSKRFNNVNYMALFVVSHFPAWGMGPELYVFNAQDPGSIAADDVTVSPALVLKNQGIEWYQTGDYAVASGDVVMAPTVDGFKIYVYYYDHNSGVIGGYVADCIAE